VARQRLVADTGYELVIGLDDALSTLRPMEADILRRRFGREGVEQETLREIGDRYALSRERIRQLQERAVNTMRAEAPNRKHAPLRPS
jgi:RNA polymerase primary sigma factor